jgi:hypothetical protein
MVAYRHRRVKNPFFSNGRREEFGSKIKIQKNKLFYFLGIVFLFFAIIAF